MFDVNLFTGLFIIIRLHCVLCARYLCMCRCLSSFNWRDDEYHCPCMSIDELRFNINQYWNNQSICIPMNTQIECMFKNGAQINRTAHLPVYFLMQKTRVIFTHISGLFVFATFRKYRFCGLEAMIILTCIAFPLHSEFSRHSQHYPSSHHHVASNLFRGKRACVCVYMVQCVQSIKFTLPFRWKRQRNA